MVLRFRILILSYRFLSVEGWFLVATHEVVSHSLYKKGYKISFVHGSRHLNYNPVFATMATSQIFGLIRQGKLQPSCWTFIKYLDLIQIKAALLIVLPMVKTDVLFGSKDPPLKAFKQG